MISKKLLYGQLHEYLTGLGYDLEVFPTHVIYRKQGHSLPIILPKTSRREEVSSFHLMAVEGILTLDGVIGAGQFAVATARKQKPANPKAPRIKATKVNSTKADRG
jgi:hypothetical protein